MDDISHCCFSSLSILITAILASVGSVFTASWATGDSGASNGSIGGGRWELLLENAGIASMHTAVTHYGTVVMLDRTNIGPSSINLSDGRCRYNPLELALKVDCSAHSVLFTPETRSLRPLFIYTDTWCSSGQFDASGTLLQTGGDNEGVAKVRRFTPCPPDDVCDWEELDAPALQDGRWYATNQLLPDSRHIVVGGRSVFTLEFLPPNGQAKTFLPFLQTSSDEQTDNLYPFVHLLPDDTLFIFANRDSIVYDYRMNTVVRALPRIPGEPRNYPSAGSSVMLPLRANESYARAEILVCGGAQLYCFLYPAPFPNASQTCGRLVITPAEEQQPEWEMDYMPFRRAMGDMLFLPTGDVLIINGAQNGCQGWDNARNPAFYPVVYNPDAPLGARFTTKAPSTIPRLYHSTANLLPDGRVLVAGSNTHQFYTYSGSFPTELRVEAFIPDYLHEAFNMMRPVIVIAPERVVYSQPFNVYVYVNDTVQGELELNMVSSPFTTHSFSQGLRFLKMKVERQIELGEGDGNLSFFQLHATAPPSPTVAPPSYYMLFVVNQGIPSKAVWVQVIYPSA
ncbi:hypothetical protein KP509_36G039400 [Ceratopteris richardii]|uniref:Galactose oxidase n=1 Tax=Ceratopteris richardii TaxID=49495 RepID=A0A8T2QCF0_CERRI|nr:hypothetical protein KP509_36G039400 [Ceratopteris richardii]